MTVTTSETTLATILESTVNMGFSSGAFAMKIRVMKMLMSMGERDLASTVGRMDIPTRENCDHREMGGLDPRDYGAPADYQPTE
jgi:hypothetical protein